jgi:uncharacterized membrane protein
MPFFVMLALVFAGYVLVIPGIALAHALTARKKSDDLETAISRLQGRISSLEKELFGVKRSFVQAQAAQPAPATHAPLAPDSRGGVAEDAPVLLKETPSSPVASVMQPAVPEADAAKPVETIPLEPMRENPAEIIQPTPLGQEIVAPLSNKPAMPMELLKGPSPAGSIASSASQGTPAARPHAPTPAPTPGTTPGTTSPTPASDRDEYEPVKRAASAAQRRSAASGSPKKTQEAPSMERLFMQALPWIGAIALGMAGLFAVKVMSDHGWFGPAVRVGSAAIVALLLIGLAQRVRHTSQQIAQAMAGAGVLTLYGVVLACNQLYASDLWIGLSSMQAMIGIAAVTAAAVVLSIRHGSMVALVGLLGGFLAPTIIMPGEAQNSVFFGYLLALQVALVVVAAKKQWWWVTMLSMLAGLGWAAGWTLLCFNPEMASTVGLFVMGTVVVFVIAGLRHERTASDESFSPAAEMMSLLPAAAVIAGLALSAWLTGRSNFQPTQWFMFGALSVGAIVLERLKPQQRGLAISALIATVTLLVGRAWQVQQSVTELSHLLWPLLAFTVVHAAGGYVAHWQSTMALRWALHSVLATAVLATVAQVLLIDEGVKISVPWSLVLVGAAVVYAIATAIAQSLRDLLIDESASEQDKAAATTRDDVTALFALASTLLTAWAIARFASERGFSAETTAVAWSIQVVLLALTAKWLRLPKLLEATPIFAWAAMGRLLFNPGFLTTRLGESVISLPLLWTYGVPAVCMVATGAILRNEKKQNLFNLMCASAFITTLAMLTLLVRHGFHVQNFWELGVRLSEWVTLGLVWGAMAAAGWELSRKLRVEALRDIGFAAGWVGVGMLLLGPLVLANPIFTGDPVGAMPVFNELLYAYGLPAALAGLAAWWMNRRGNSQASSIVQIIAVVLALVCVTLEVRQAFQGTTLDGPSPDNREWYAYSAAWIVSSGLLMLGGLLRKSVVLRHAAMGVMVASVLKVFLFDTRHLTDLWRVLSYFGLGVSLLLLAWVYQRFVFGSSKETDDENSESSQQP